MTMADPILEEIRRFREKLLDKHGGIEGYLRYVRKLDRVHRQAQRKAAKRRSQPLRSAR